MRNICNVLVAVCTTVFLLCIHESGHVIAAWLGGGTVSDVAIFTLRPHVTILGLANGGQEAVRAVAGSAASLFACFGLILGMPVLGPSWRIAKDTTVAFGSVELIGWCVSSVIGNRSLNPDDAQRFLAASGLTAFPVLTVCAFVAGAGVLVLYFDGRRMRGPLRRRHTVGSAMLSKAAGAGRHT
jgi:hypothetical protein